MWIRRFEVSGFKNFVEPVVLDELAAINVIHGDNNVGKSNLLEAMHLFFGMRLVDGHPRVERRPVSEAAAYTGLDPAVVPPTDSHARLGYITSDGLVEVPPFVLSHLGIEGGGSVIFVDRDEGGVEIMTHARFLELLASGGEKGEPDAGN